MVLPDLLSSKLQIWLEDRIPGIIFIHDQSWRNEIYMCILVGHQVSSLQVHCNKVEAWSYLHDHVEAVVLATPFISRRPYHFSRYYRGLKFRDPEDKTLSAGAYVTFAVLCFVLKNRRCIVVVRHKAATYIA